MLTPRELNELVQKLRTTKVLTIYYDARVTDPAMRDAWRPAIASAIRPIRMAIADEAERAELDRAAAFLDDRLPPLGGVWGAPGWVAFLTAAGPRYVEELPIHTRTIAVWRDGPAVAPYLRALKQHRPVVVVLVDSQSARLYRYAWSRLTALPDMTLQVQTEAATPRQTPSVAPELSHPGARSAVGSERMQRRRSAAFQRLITPLGRRLAELAGDDGWIVIGGTPEWAHLAGNGLPAQLEGRVLVSSTLQNDEREEDIAREAERAATELRATHGRVLVDRLTEQSGANGRGAMGVAAVQRALRVPAVNLLIMSPEFVRLHPDDAEDITRAALNQGADVEVLSSDAAARLDKTAGGIAARLRFSLDRPAQPDATAREQHNTAPMPSAG
jgi:hypothetical protein